MKDALKIFAALSDPTRLRAVLLLLERDLCVCELEFILKMSQSRVSHQLRILREAGLVDDRREGQWVIYAVRPEARKSLRLILQALGPSDAASSGEIAADRENLRLCVKRCLRPPARAHAGVTRRS